MMDGISWLKFLIAYQLISETVSRENWYNNVSKGLIKYMAQKGEDIINVTRFCSSVFTHRRSCRRPHQYQSESHFLLRAIGSLPGRHCNMTFIESDWSAKLANQQCFSLCVRLINASMNSCDFRMTYYDGIEDHNPRVCIQILGIVLIYWYQILKSNHLANVLCICTLCYYLVGNFIFSNIFKFQYRIMNIIHFSGISTSIWILNNYVM